MLQCLLQDILVEEAGTDRCFNWWRNCCFAMISVALFIVMIVFSRQVAVIMQAPKEAVGLTSLYVKICGSGIFFIVAYNFFQQYSGDLETANHHLYSLSCMCY